MNCYTEVFTAMCKLDNSYVCLAGNEELETLVPEGFLRIYNIDLGDTFSCKVDYRGNILIDTIIKYDI